MSRASLLSLLLVIACSDSAEVITPPDAQAQPDTGLPDVGSDAALTPDVQADVVNDVLVADSPVEAGGGDASADADGGCGTGYEICAMKCVAVSTYLTDAKNCGYCSHDCLGNTCSGGLCAADLIGTNLPNPTALAVDSSNVYFTTIGVTQTTTSGSVYQCPVTGCGGGLLPMSTGYDNPESIAVDSKTVYWANTGALAMATGSVLSCPISGCGTMDAKRTTIANKLQFILGIALDSTKVYFNVWGASPYYGKGFVDSCPLAGCTGTPANVITGESKPAFLAVDSTNAYAATAGGGAGIPNVQTVTLPGPSAGTTLYSGNAFKDQIDGFAVYLTNFYFADGFANTLIECPTTGCPMTPTAFANTSSPYSVAVDSQGVYWLDNAGLEYCPLTGCPSLTPVLLATSSNSMMAIALQGSFVYWVEQDGTGAVGQVLRVAR